MITVKFIEINPQKWYNEENKPKGESGMARPNLAAQLVKYRKARGLTQEALASQLNVTPQAVSKWEKGGYPDAELLPAIARALDVSLDVLFGLRSEEAVDPVTLMNETIRSLPEEERAGYCMNLFYAMMCAYSNIQSSEFRIPRRLLRETYAQLKTDREQAVARLNKDMQYFCFLRIPEEGLDSYAQITDRLLEFFRLLGRRETLEILYFFASSERNHLWSPGEIIESTGMEENTARDVLDRLDKMGAIWTLKIDRGTDPVYGYTHSLPLESILVLATSFINYLSNTDPNIELWNRGAFRASE